MKKFITIASMALLTVILAVTLAGCGAFSKLQKAYEDAAYTCEVTKADENDIKEMEERIAKLEGDQKKEAEDALANLKKTEILTVSNKSVPVAIITSYPSEDSIKAILGEKLYNSASESGFIKGKLVFTPIADVTGKAFEIFKANA